MFCVHGCWRDCSDHKQPTSRPVQRGDRCNINANQAAMLRILRVSLARNLVRPEKWDDSKVGFRDSNASGGRIVLLPGAFWVHVLPKWPLWARLFYSVIYSVSELRRACFRQARVARAVLPPHALFRAGAFALPPCAPKSHMCRLPHLGLSENLRHNFKGLLASSSHLAAVFHSSSSSCSLV